MNPENCRIMWSRRVFAQPIRQHLIHTDSALQHRSLLQCSAGENVASLTRMNSNTRGVLVEQSRDDIELRLEPRERFQNRFGERAAHVLRRIVERREEGRSDILVLEPPRAHHRPGRVRAGAPVLRSYDPPGEPGRIPFRVLEARDRGRARVELRLAGLGTREHARAWSGARVSIAHALLRPLPEGEYYQRDLIGLAVRTPDGRHVGHVQEIWPTGGHDLLVVATSGEPVLVPAVEPVLTRVDLAAREIWIDPPAGLIPEPS